MVGQTLAARPEDQYQALLDYCCFGARVIIENYEERGTTVNEIRIADGLLKNHFLRLMRADITRRPLSTVSLCPTPRRTHSPSATAWATLGREIACLLTMMTDEFGGPVPLGPWQPSVTTRSAKELSPLSKRHPRRSHRRRSTRSTSATSRVRAALTFVSS